MSGFDFLLGTTFILTGLSHIFVILFVIPKIDKTCHENPTGGFYARHARMVNYYCMFAGPKLIRKQQKIPEGCKASGWDCFMLRLNMRITYLLAILAVIDFFF